MWLTPPFPLKACTMVGLDPAKVEAVTLRKAKEVADTKGVYKSYESNTSEHEKRRDLKRMTNYQSRFSAQGQGKLQPAPTLVFVGRFQVCVSDFFHLLNLGVCYQEKNGKIFKKNFDTPLTLAPSHTWRVNKFTSKFFCIPALEFQIPF